MVPARDGIKLGTTVFLPARAGQAVRSRFPAVVERTPYNKDGASSAVIAFFVSRGYAVVIQDVRGRYRSEGRWAGNHDDGPDGNRVGDLVQCERDDTGGEQQPDERAGELGRKVGARDTLTKQFIVDLAEAWEFYGVRALKMMALEDPSNFVKVVASLLPKEAKVDATETMSEEQLVARIRELAANLGLEADLSLASPPQRKSTTH